MKEYKASSPSFRPSASRIQTRIRYSRRRNPASVAYGCRHAMPCTRPAEGMHKWRESIRTARTAACRTLSNGQPETDRDFSVTPQHYQLARQRRSFEITASATIITQRCKAAAHYGQHEMSVQTIEELNHAAIGGDLPTDTSALATVSSSISDFTGLVR